MSVIGATARGTLAVAAAAAVGHALDIDPIVAAAATALGAVGSVVANARDSSPAALIYRLSCWLGAGTWNTYCLTTETGPWDRHHWYALGLSSLAAAVFGPISQRDHNRTETERKRVALLMRSDAQLAAAWEARILAIASMRVRVEQVSHWPTKTGYDLTVELPGRGATRARLATFEDALASDAKLPNGCGVEVANGPHRGAALLRVATHNRLEDEVTHPGDYSSRSILDPCALGEHSNGATAEAILREYSALVVGMKGSGKTGLLHCLTCAIGRCRDALVWHIDLNGGGLSQPWLHPWLEGETDRPAIDWAACEIDTALLMSEIALVIAKDRKKSYRHLKFDTDETLLPVSEHLPEIVIVVDESAESLSPTNRDPKVAQLRANLEEIQRIGRNEAVNVVFSSLRATSDMISVNVKKQSAVRVGMFVTDDEELSYLFGWNKGINPDELIAKGCGFLQVDKTRPRAFKAYYMKPKRDIRPAAIAISRYRPELDDAGRKAACREFGDAYETRYHWMRISFTEARDEAAAVENADVVARIIPTTPAQFTGVTAGWDSSQHRGVTAGRNGTPPAATGGRPRLYVVPDMRRGPLRAEQVFPIGDGVPQDLARALAVFDTAGDDRMHSEDLATALRCTTTELADMLRPYGVAARPNAFERHGQRRRGYDRADLIAATQRNQAGDAKQPADADELELEGAP